MRGSGRAAAWALAILVLALSLLPAAARAEVAELCRFDGKRLAEISGLAASPTHDGIVWAHNDSGGGPRIYALDVTTCDIRAVLRVRGVPARDTEAIAAGTGTDGNPVLWWGDIGDNTGERRFVEIYEIPEPRDLRSTTVTATKHRVRLDRPSDAEALMAEGARLWMIGKGLLGGTVWELPRLDPRGGAVRARAVGSEEGLVTDAAMRPGGGYAVRDYSEVRIYSGLPPGTLIARQPLPEQVQGESMTWTADGMAVLVASEGDDRLLLVPVDVPPASTVDVADTGGVEAEDRPTDAVRAPEAAGAPISGETPSASPSTSVAAALAPVDRVGSLAVTALAIGAAVFVASSVAVVIIARLRSRRPSH